jgi:class 3 adenylate cyclase
MASSSASGSAHWSRSKLLPLGAWMVWVREFGCHIAHGYATLGRIGFEDRHEYAAIGVVPNLAARLCGEAKDGQILIDNKVRAAIEGMADLEPLDALVLKGFHRPIMAANVRTVVVS